MLYFFIFGTFILIMLTYSDIKKKLVDARYNYMMHGLALSLITHHDYLIIPLIVLILGFMWAKGKLEKWIGKGDLTALHWILYGTFIINPFVTAIFGMVFAFITMIYGGLKALYFGKNKMATPFYPVILCSFVITGLIYFFNYFP